MSTRIIRRIAGLALAIGIGVLGTPSPANANMRMELVDSSGNGVVLTDTGNTGVLSFNGSIGTNEFIVNVTTGVSQPPLPLPAGDVATLDLNSINVASTTGGTLTIILENNNYSGTGLLTDTSRVGGTLNGSGATMTASSAVYPDNVVPVLPSDTSGVVSGLPSPPSLGGISVLSFTSSSPSFNSSRSVSFTPTAGQFGLAKEFVITLPAGGQFSGDLLDAVVPEPATVAMALTGLPFLAVVALRRRNKSRA